MNQRVHDLTKWKFVEEGESLRYENDKRRTVILEVNCPSEVCFYVQQDLESLRTDPERIADDDAGRRPSGDPGREVSFVGVCKGRDRLEFGVDGPFDLIVEGGGAYVYTFDGQDVATRVVSPLVFTRLANRKQRNPHLEMIEYQMKLNQQRFFEQLEVEQENRLEAIKNDLATYLPNRNEQAPAERVGRATGQDGLEEREATEVVADVERPAGKRKRKAKDFDPEDVPF